MKVLKNAIMAAALTGVLITATACGSSGSADSGSAISGSAGSETTETGSSGTTVSETFESDADDYGSESDTVSELGTVSTDESTDEALIEAEGPYQSEMNEYLEANTTDSLLESHEAVQFDTELFNLDGSSYDSSSALLKKDLKYLSYSSGTAWLVREDQIDGFDGENNTPYRGVFADDGTLGVLTSELSQLFYLYYGESVDEMTENGDTVVFTSYLKSTDDIAYQVGDGETEAAEGSDLKRITTFNKETKELVSSVATYETDGADPVTVESVTLTTDVGDSSEVTDLISKLDSSDAHSIKVVLDPGTENEETLTSKVGKGCYFNLMLWDYSYYTDEECTKAADDDVLYDTQNDLTIYAKVLTYEDDADAGSELTDIDGEEFEFDVSSLETEAEG